MKCAVFSSKPYDRVYLTAANAEHDYALQFFDPRLTHETAPLAVGFDAVCVFVNDELDEAVLKILAKGGTRLIALRCAGFNNVDLAASQRLGMTVVRVPAYSPYSVAEHTVALILTLNRKVHRAHARVREGNFALDGLLGFDLNGRTIGIVGTGSIGSVLARIMKGFGCRLLAYDPYPNPECVALGVEYVDLDRLLSDSDIISLHCPLTPQSFHMINATSLSKIKAGAMLINTSRGGLVDTLAVIESLKSGRLAYLGLDVYEEEADLFFEDLSAHAIQDDVFARLMTFPNVLITGHQAFFTEQALRTIASTTIGNIHAFFQGESVPNQVVPK